MNQLDEIINTLKPLVKSYAREMRLLIAEDEQTNIEFYKLAFGNFFHVCDITRDGEEALARWKQDQDYYDLIITDMEMPKMNGLELIQNIRKDSMEQSIIVITGITDLVANQDLAYYYIDGLLPKPVNTKKLYILLYRVLTKISEKKAFEFYVQNMEEELSQAIEHKNNLSFVVEKLSPLKEQQEVEQALKILRTIIGKREEDIQHQTSVVKSTKSISSQKEEDLRFSTVDRILSSQEFMEQLDDSIIDKIEDFTLLLDNFVSKIYDIENEEPQEAIQSLKSIIRYLEEFVNIVNNLVLFPVVSRAFNNLNLFLNNITVQDFEDREKKLLLASLLLLIEKDISKWIQTIFIKQEASNIYYFDASFSNGVLEIEAMFCADPINEDEIEEIEFF